jgi:phosphatidate cytidylyltransferase
LLTVGVAGGLEFYTLLRKGGYHPNRGLGALWLGLLILHNWQPELLPLDRVLVFGLILTLIDALRQPENALAGWMATSTGALYIGLTVGQGLALRQLPDGLWWLLFAFLVTWMNDTTAYFVGTSLGRHKLWPRLSPKKTWEGTLGGWTGAALIGGALIWFTPLQAPVLMGVLLGAACGGLALLGDLAVSMLKRQVGAKDSGRFLPGHGGFLDRMDSLLFVLPFVYQVVTW